MDKNSYNGRFGASAAPHKEENAQPRRKNTASSAARKPSGFSTAGQAPRHRTPAPEAPAESKKDKKLRLKREKKQQKEKRAREPRAKKPWLLRALIGLLIVALIGLILLIIFGDRGTYHQMPTITREEVQPSFEPEKTPLPGVEEAI